MVRLVSPGGIEVLACEEAADRLLESGFAEANEKVDEKPKATTAAKPKATPRKSAAKTKGA